MLSKKEWEAIDAEAEAYRKISADHHSEARAEIARLQAEVVRLEVELAAEEEMHDECQKSLEGMGRKWAAEKALADRLAWGALDLDVGLGSAKIKDAMDAYHKARGL